LSLRFTGAPKIAIAIGPRFPHGRVCITTNALAIIPSEEIRAALRRHNQGDWGDLDPPDRAQNERALTFGGRLFSAYTAAKGTRFYVITEPDRTATTILLPEDY
jgi:hypothetical protein